MDSRRLLFLLKSAVDLKSLKQGKLLHQNVVTLGLQNNIPLSKTLINLYFSCQDFSSGKLVFQTIDNPSDITLWNGLLAAYCKNFMFAEGLDLFKKLLHYPYLKADDYTFPSVLKACSGLNRVNCGKMIHSHVVKIGFSSDVVVTSSVVGMYAKCDVFGAAIQLFDEMLARDVACWNTVMSCYYQSGQCDEALELFQRMKGCGYEPDSVTFTTAISSCARLLDLNRGKEIHRELVRAGLVLDVFVSAALVGMYGKCGCLDMAVDVFERTPKKSLVSWNSLIAGYSLRGDSKSCIELLLRMCEKGIKPNSTTLSSILVACSKSVQLRHGKFIHGYIMRSKLETDIFIDSLLVDLYCKSGIISSAKSVFDKMPKTDIVAWNVMISGYVSVGCYLEALGIFADMREAGIKHDAVTFTSALAACSQLAALEQGKEIHKLIIESKLENGEIVMGALLEMYAKCGAVDEAFSIFNQLPERDLMSWTSMIAAYGSHGQAFKALNLFNEMLQSSVKPDRVTFLAVICACSHAGLVDEGCQYFNLMLTDYEIQPTVEDYSCLVDLLGRCGRLHEAYSIIQRNPSVREDVEMLSTLFSACHKHGESELGQEIAGLLIEKDVDDPSTYVTLSNMYASAKKWDEMRKVRLKMKQLGLKKNPGCSWIEVDKRMQPFFKEDKLFPQADFVFECLSILKSHMDKDEKYPAAANNFLHESMF